MHRFRLQKIQYKLRGQNFMQLKGRDKKWEQRKETFKEITDTPRFTVARALASQFYDPGSVPVVGMWVEFLVGSLLALKVFLRILRFSSLHKNQQFQIPIRPGRQVFTHEPLRRLGDYSLHYGVKFDLLFFFLIFQNIKKKRIFDAYFYSSGSFSIFLNYFLRCLLFLLFVRCLIYHDGGPWRCQSWGNRCKCDTPFIWRAYE